MIKLSNQQIGALSKKITNELKAPAEEYNKKIKESEEYINFFDTNEDCLTYKKLSEKYDFSYPSSSLNLIRATYFKDKFVSVPFVSVSEVEQEIILATIDASDLQTLIQIVSEKFK